MQKVTLKKKRSRPRRRRNPKRKPINVLASALTCAGLYCGMASILAAIDQDYAKAAYLILAALVFDMLDGTVAQLTHTTSDFGKQLDSLADLVSFGAAPAILIYTAYLAEQRVSGTPIGHYGSLMAILYVICGALRLARFNVYQAAIRDYFTGLPIPAAAMTVASFVLFTTYQGWHVAFWVLGPLTCGLAFLMVSRVRYPKDKMKSMVLHPRSAFNWLVVCGVLIAIVHFALQKSAALVLFPVSAVYVVYGIADTIVARIHHGAASQNESDSGETQNQPPSEAASLKTEDRL